MEDLFQIGIITGTHGLKGEVKVFPTTDDKERFLDLDTVLIDTGKELIEKKVQYCKFFKQFVFVKFEGLDDMVILHTVLLTHSPLGVQHLAELPARVAVQVGGEDALLGLVPVEDVVDADVQTALTSQNFCDSHTYSSLKCKCC